MTVLTELEKEVLEKLLNGKAPIFEILFQQYRYLSVTKREMTGVGFFTYFSIPKDVQCIPGEPSFLFGDVHADLKGLEGGAGFLLTINKGYLYDLEGYCYDGAWPQAIEIIRIYYDDNGKRDEAKVIQTFHMRNPIE
ncbi:MAG: hypothetical protein WBW81_02800 [Methylocella sp.]